MTPDEEAEFTILALATDGGKFALGLGYVFEEPAHQHALERLQMRRWVTLIDLSPIAYERAAGQMMRIFLASPEAMAWRAEALRGADEMLQRHR